MIFVPKSNEPYLKILPAHRANQTVVAILLLLIFLRVTILANAQVESNNPQQHDNSNLTLDTLLDRLESNILDYRQSVPDLFCTERAQSERKTGGQTSGPDFATPGGALPSERTPLVEFRQRSESSFRLRRTTELGATGLFEESRVVRSVNGKQPTRGTDNLSAPAILYGIFSNGLNILSRQGRACFGFRFRDARKNKQIVVDFADLPIGERVAGCPPFEKTSGRIFVDSVSMHVIRIEKRTPDHELVPGVFGQWEWTEEYAPVTLLNRTFWMPKSIRSRSVSDSGNFRWTFDATYSDYHLFHAKSRIVR